MALQDILDKDKNRLRLYEAAVNVLNTDASPLDQATDELGCADTVSAIHNSAFPESPISHCVSTYQLRKVLRESPLFRRTNLPAPGDIILSATGYGNGSIPHGHVGIVMAEGGVASNDSRKQFLGLFRLNYTIDKWRQKYELQGGYPVEFFRRI